MRGGLRQHKRILFAAHVRYSFSVTDFKESKRSNNIAVSVDISKGGLGIITDSPLERGHILAFEDEIKVRDITSARSTVVRWTGRISDKYRAGLKFV